MRPAGEERIFRGRVGFADEPHRVHAHLERARIVPGARAGFAIEIDESAEALECTSNDRDH
jgi:hypothetical protein